MSDQGAAPAAAPGAEMSTEEYAKYLQSLGYDPSYAEYYKNYYAQMYSQQPGGAPASGPGASGAPAEQPPMSSGWGSAPGPQYGGPSGYGGSSGGSGHYGGGHMMGGGPGGGAQPSPNLWIGNLPGDISEYELRAIFDPFGPIEHIRVLNQKNCAFVKYADLESASRAHAAGPSLQARGMSIKVGWGKGDGGARQGGMGGGPGIGPGGGGSNEPSTNLWVGNLDFGVTEDEVRSIFSRYGPIDRVKVLSNKNCAFVNFVNLPDTLAAMNALNGYVLRSQPIRINFGKSDPRHGQNDRDRGDRDRGYDRDRGDRRDNRSPRGPREALYDPPLPPADVKQKDVIDKLAATIVQSNMPSMEDMIKQKQKDNPLFSFLDDNHEFNNYYRWKIYDIKNPGAPVPAKLGRPRFPVGGSPGPVGASPSAGGRPPWAQPSNDANIPPWARQQEIQLAPLPAPEQPLETTWTDDFDTNDELSSMDADVLAEILRALMPTKESIRGAKDWVMERSRAGKMIAFQIRQFVDRAADFTPRLNALYLVNDVLQNSQRRRPGGEGDLTLDDLASAFMPHIGAMLFSTYVSQTPDRQEKVSKLLKIWKDKFIYPDNLLSRMEGIMRGSIMVPNPPALGRRPPPPAAPVPAPGPAGAPWQQRGPSPPRERGMYSAVPPPASMQPGGGLMNQLDSFLSSEKRKVEEQFAREEDYYDDHGRGQKRKREPSPPRDRYRDYDRDRDDYDRSKRRY